MKDKLKEGATGPLSDHLFSFATKDWLEARELAAEK